MGAYTNDNGTFSHCVASSVYVDGTVLAFAIDGDQKSWRIGLSNQSWALPVGATYPVAYRVDGDTPSYNTVRMVSPKLAIFDLPPYAAVFQRFRKGRVLVINAMGHEFSYKLTDSSAALNAALTCTTLPQNKYAGQSTNPFAGGVAAPANRQPSIVLQRPELVQEGMTTLRTLLTNAGMNDAVVLAPDETTGTAFHAVFGSPNVFGGISIFPDNTPSDVAEFSLSASSQNCGNGSFATARKVEPSGLINVSTMCKTSAELDSREFLALQRVGGGAILVTIGSKRLPTETTDSPSSKAAGRMIDAGFRLR